MREFAQTDLALIVGPATWSIRRPSNAPARPSPACRSCGPTRPRTSSCATWTIGRATRASRTRSISNPQTIMLLGDAKVTLGRFLHELDGSEPQDSKPA